MRGESWMYREPQKPTTAELLDRARADLMYWSRELASLEQKLEAARKAHIEAANRLDQLERQ